MFDGAHIHRLEAKHEPTHVNRGGGGAASIFLYIPPRCDGGFVHLLSTEESNDKLNPSLVPRRSTYRGKGVSGNIARFSWS